MALAAFKLVKCTGTNAATETDATGNLVRWLNTDVHSQTQGVNPIAVPVTGSANNSFETWLLFELTDVPNTKCENFITWGPSTQPKISGVEDTDLTLYMGTTGTGVDPKVANSTVAGTIQHTNYYSASNKLTVGVQPGDNIINAIAEQTDYIVTQLRVAVGATQGEMDLHTFSLGYDES